MKGEIQASRTPAQARAFFEHELGAPRYVCAPMVRGSERAFRELVRAQGVHLCYLPMIQAAKLVAGEPYEHSLIDVDGEESPVVAQLAGRDADELVAAGRLIQDKVAAIDLNLGCPQICAKRGRYGAFLLEEPDLVVSIVRAMSSALTCPVWCKIRLLETPEATLVFAKQLEEAGCSLLAIHARTRAQLGEGPVDLDTLHAVADALEIPVVANGGFANKTAADKLLNSTPVSAVMFASELLANPRLLTDETPMDDALAVRRAEEYLEYALRYPVPDHRHLEVHLRHILRRTVKNRPELIRWWSVLSRPWMKTPWQYLCMLALMAQARGLPAMDLEARFPDRTPLRTMPELRRPELVANPKNAEAGLKPKNAEVGLKSKNAEVNLKSTMPQDDTSTVLHDDKPNDDTVTSAQDT